MTSATLPTTRRISPSVWVAGALALALHGAWWYVLARPWTTAAPPLRTKDAPRITLLPSSYTRSEAHLLGSPILFALPSGLGFSGQAGREVDRAPAALQAPPRQPVLLDRDATAEPAPDFLRDLEQTVAGPGAGTTWVPPVTPAFTSTSGSTGFVVRVYWPDGAPAVQGGLPGAGVLAPLLKDQPWELGAMVIFDAQGGVRHVFVEKTTTSREYTEFAARALRDLRIAPDGQETRFRVVVQYEQDAGSRVPAGGAVRP